MKNDVAAALYTFAAWLTTREEPVTAGAEHEAGPWAELVDEFCQANEVPDPDMSASTFRHPARVT